MFGTDEEAGRPAEQYGMGLVGADHSAGGLENAAEGDAELVLVGAGVRHPATEAEEARAR